MAEAVQFDVKARDQATPTLNAIGREVDKLADKLDKLGAKNPSPRITLDSTGAKTKLDEFNRALAAVSNKRVRLDVDITGTREVGDLRRELAYLTDRKVKIRVDTADSNQRLRTLTERLRTISDTRAKVDVTVTGEAKLDQVLGKLVAIRDMSPVRVRVEIGTGDSLYQLGEVERLLRRINGNTSTATVSVRQQWDATLEAKIGKLVTGLLKIPAAASAGSAALGVLGAAAFSLAGGLAEAGGAALLVPGAVAAIGGVVGTVKLGVLGLGDAFKAVGEGDAKKLAEAEKGLSSNARELVNEVARLKPAWTSVQLDVQQRLLAGLGAEAKQLSSAYLPSMRSGLSGVAVELNKGAVGIADFLESGAAVSRVDSIFRNTALSVGNIAPAATNVTAALLDIADVGASMLPKLTDGAESATQAFAQFIAQARQSGQLEQWIQTGIDRIKQLGDIAGNVGGILGGIFTASTAAGTDFITLLQRGTQAVDDFVHSAEGQATLKAFFEESRQTIDALTPGLVAAKDAAVGFVQGFANTDGLARFAAGVSDAARVVGPLVADLGELAGNTLGVLGASLTTTASLFSPVIDGAQGLLGALGGLAPTALAAWAAFAGAKLIAGYMATAAASLRTFSAAQMTAVASSNTLAGAYTRVAASWGTAGMAGALSTVGKALPYVGIAVVALSAIWDEFSVHVDDAAKSVVDGNKGIEAAIRQTQAEVERGTLFWFSAAQQQQAYAQAADDTRAAIEGQLAALGPMEQAQARAKISQQNYNDAVAAFPAGDARIKTAYDVWQRDTQNLADLQGKAATETDKHKTAIEKLADAANKAANTQLDYEDAVKKVRDAEKAAGEELTKSGAKSDEYQTKVRDVARAMLSQAEAARKVAEANGTAADGQAAYVGELLKLNDGSKAGREALVKIATGMTDAERAAYSAAASASGLNTEIVKLPNGKEITVVVAGDTSALPTVEQQIKTITEKQYVGEITFQGNATMANGTVLESVRFANDQTGIIKLDANGEPVTAVVNGQKYLIDHSTGVMTIQGEPKPGVDSLNGFIYTVNAATGVASIDANPTLGLAQLTSFIGKVDTAKGTATIDGDPTLANGATTQAIRFADGSYGTITINGNETPVNGKITASVRYADGSIGTIQLNANDQNVKAAQQNAERTINAPVVFDPNTAEADRARARLAAELKVKVTFTSTGEVKGRPDLLGASGGALIGYSGGGMVGFAGGGRVLPGYAPGRDTIPGQIRGGPRVMLSPGEAVLVPELVRAIGPGRIMRANAQASGRPGAIVGRWPGGFAGGGLASAASLAPTAPAAAAPAGVDGKYAEALDAAAKAGTELADVQQLAADTATALGEQTALTTEQVTALTDAATNATTVEQAYQVGLQAVQLANDAVTAAAQVRTAAEQIATDTTATALGQANAYTSGLTTLGAQAGGPTTGGINTLTGAVSTETGTEATAQGQAQAYTGGLAALGGQAGGATTGGITALTGAVNASGGATVTATGQAQGYTGQLTTLGGQAGGATAAGLQQAATAAQAQGAASAAAGGQAQAQAGQLQALGTSAGGAATQLQGVATAINNLPDGDFTVTANGRMGAITGTPTVAKATGGVLPGYTPGRDVHDFYSPTAGRLLLSGGEAVMRPEWTAAMGPAYVDAANKAARAGTLRDFLARTAPREGQAGGDGSMLATGGIWGPKPKEQRYAMGGTIASLGNPFPPMPTDLWKTLSEQMAAAMTPAMQEAVKTAETEAAGGDALAWAKTQVGKPYIWGGVGPAGYDAVVENALIYGPFGATPIQQLTAGQLVWSMSRDGKAEARPVVALVDQGEKEAFKIRTRNRALETTAKHPFPRLKLYPQVATLGGDTRDGTWGIEWVYAENLSPGDMIVTFQGDEDTVRYADLIRGNEFPEDMAWLLGVFIGDGCLNNGSVRICVYGELRDRVREVSLRHWGTAGSEHPTAGVIIGKASAARWMQANGFVGKAHEKRIPAIVWSWQADAQRAFLEGYMAADGHQPKDPKRHGDIVYKSCSEDLIRGVRALHVLLGDGVSNVTRQDRTKPIVIQGVTVKNARPLHCFTVRRASRAAASLAGGGTKPFNGAHDFVQSWQSAFGVQKVLAVESIGMRQTWDIEVEETHNFVAEGLLVHNCSGFMSAVLNVLNGRPPHSRVGTTASFPWGGFQPGIGGRFSIGAFKGDPGHMAGTLGGTNVESSGSVGVRVGGGARGADNGMFTIRAHVADGGILPHFDQGGLASGRGLMVKDVIHPERILDARTTAAFEQLVPLLGSMPDRVRLGSQPVVTGAGGGRGDVAGVVAALQAQTSRMAAEIRAVATEAATRPAVTVNDTSGNPVEAGRAAALAYRMAR